MGLLTPESGIVLFSGLTGSGKTMTLFSAMIELTFKDLNVVMIGEIRDVGSARIAVEAALSGHLVISIMEAEDGVASLGRMAAFGVEPAKMARAMGGIVSQRLARKTCPDCQTEYQASPSELDSIGMAGQSVTLHKGKGCQACDNTGYKGRFGIFEILVLNEEIRNLVVANASADRIRRAAIEAGMLTFRQDGLRKALNGRTTIEEVLKATAAQE